MNYKLAKKAGVEQLLKTRFQNYPKRHIFAVNYFLYIRYSSM